MVVVVVGGVKYHVHRHQQHHQHAHNKFNMQQCSDYSPVLKGVLLCRSRTLRWAPMCNKLSAISPLPWYAASCNLFHQPIHPPIRNKRMKMNITHTHTHTNSLTHTILTMWNFQNHYPLDWCLLRQAVSTTILEPIPSFFFSQPPATNICLIVWLFDCVGLFAIG